MGIRLELLDVSHLDHVEPLLDDSDVLRFTRVPDPPPDGFARTWLERYEEHRAAGTREGFAIVGDDGTFLGLALAPEIDRAGRQVELGYITAPAARGRGVAVEALRLLTAWAFGEAGALRSVLYISTENTASQRVAERAGYVFEGVLRSVHFKDGIREDTQIWSRLPADA